jgi:SAM-dependent methyltransferase
LGNFSQEKSTYQGKNKLFIIENLLPKYNYFLVKKFFKNSGIHHLQNKKKERFRTLDFGAGNGNLALIWKKQTAQNVECLEIDKVLQNEIEIRGFKCWNSISAIEGKYNFIYSSNVLEHIKNDEDCLQELEALLAEKGRIAIYVPAFNVLYSELDRSVGHFRRYSKRELIKKVEKAGLNIICCEYVDFLGFFASLTLRILHWQPVTEFKGPKCLPIYDTFIFPVSIFIDKITKGKILGKNLCLIAEKRTLI